MKDFIINLDDDKVEIINIHFDLRNRLKVIFYMIFSGYLSFSSKPECEITYNYSEDAKSVTEESHG